jgi:hypothetical protein
VKPGQVQYAYRHAIGGFFEFPTENARQLLPPHLHPVEPHHGQSVLSVMAFDFTSGSVDNIGPYGELVLSVHVAPRLEAGRPMARAAFYPFLVGTTTQAAREHAITRWHLPHYMHDIELAFTIGEHDIRVAAAHDAAPILDLHITDYQWEPVEHYYQAYMHDAAGSYMATMALQGSFSENEEERGGITLHDHAFNTGLEIDAVNATPFRELWMRDGTQTFDPLETLTPGVR